MNDLRRHARELLEASRRERTPSAPARQRLLQRLLDSAAQTSLAAQEPPPLAQRLGWRAKVAVMGCLFLTIAAALWLASR